jgi:hypothetical protein
MRKAMFDEDMKTVMGEVGEPVTVNGKTLKAVVGDIEEGIAQELAGYLPETTASFTFRRSDFKGVLPKAQDKIIYNGTVYRILVPAIVPGGGSVRYECGAATA